MADINEKNLYYWLRVLLMQNMYLSKISTKDIFYLKQLWVNVFYIHNLKK